jgi:hypothetical protein
MVFMVYRRWSSPFHDSGDSVLPIRPSFPLPHIEQGLLHLAHATTLNAWNR